MVPGYIQFGLEAGSIGFAKFASQSCSKRLSLCAVVCAKIRKPSRASGKPADDHKWCTVATRSNMEAGAVVGKRVQSSVAESRKRYPQPHGKNKNTFAVRVKNEAEDVSLNVEELVCAVKLGCFLVDVRSPGEYAKGHVPGAANIPLFEDYERSKVATARSKQGKAVALGIALKLVRYKLDSYVSSILHVIKSHRGFLKPGNSFPKIPVKVVFYCWSGGMRSSAVWWLFRRSASTALFTSGIVCGGYRSYREFARSLWDPAIHTVKQSDVSLGRPNQLGDTNGRCSGLPLSKGSRICIIGGRTGVGKTRVLSALLRAGEQIIDLERIARHSGSVFGWVGQSSKQPVSEHFTNLVAYKVAWMQVSPHWIFIEDEGPHVGKCSLEPSLFKCMRCAPLVINILAPKCLRLRMLVDDYASGECRTHSDWSSAMLLSIGKLQKRLGEEHTKSLQYHLDAGQYETVAEGLLDYYDVLYDTHLGEQRPEKKDTCAAEYRKRIGTILEVRAFSIGSIGKECDGPRANLNPDLFDVDRAIKDILHAVAAFEHRAGTGLTADF